MTFASAELMPRERLIKYGATSLSNAELLALIMRVGGKNKNVLELATRIITQFNGVAGLKGATMQQLISVKHLGVVKSCAILALCELSLRLYCDAEADNKKIRSPDDIFDLVRRDFIGQKKEILVLVCLDSRNRFISKDLLSVGSINETLVSPREVFMQVLRREAVSFVLCHNHPSNEPTPSSEDIVLTEKIAAIGANLGIALIDHLIICESKFSSLKALNIFETFKLSGKEVKK